MPMQPMDPDGHSLRELDDRTLAALFANLAKGTEQQHREEETGLLQQLADRFRERAAAASPVGPAGIAGLVDGIRADLEAGIPSARALAVATADRGALRALAWCEKTSTILKSILQRYERDGDGFLRDARVYVCDICGFVYVGDAPPDVCPVCKVPKLKILEIARR